MPDTELLTRFQSCVRYQQASTWQKPLLAPGRFLRNQLRKRGIIQTAPGVLLTTPTFFLPEFTVVSGELVSECIFGYGVYEVELTEAFLQLVKPGHMILDIGMHLGYYATLFATLAGSAGQVHAFEPTPSTREIAARNTGRFPQLRVHPLAVWSAAQKVTLQDYGQKWMGFNSLKRSKLAAESPAPRAVEVQAITLDEFRASLDRPISLLKIDAESAEREIIAGGRKMLQTDQPLVSLEVGDDEGGRDSVLLIQDMQALDFVPWEFKEGRFRRHQPRETYHYDNLIFAPAKTQLDAAGLP